MFQLFLYNTISKSIFLFLPVDKMIYKFFININNFLYTVYFLWGFSETQLKFFLDLTVVDYPISFYRFLSIYNIVSLLYNDRIFLKFFLDTNLTISSITYTNTNCYACASWFERECLDWFGIFDYNHLYFFITSPWKIFI